MDRPPSKLPMFMAGLAAGALLAGAVAYTTVHAPERGPAAAAPSARHAPAVAAAAVDDPPCTFSPMVKAAASDDGSANLGDVAGGAALIVKGKEAAAAGRDKDAEAAFLAACKLPVGAADKAGAIVRADAKYNLARHYASLAEEGSGPRGELNQRARSLFTESLAVYQARLGTTHEKVRFAQQAMASLGGTTPAQEREQVAAVSRPSAAKEPVKAAEPPKVAEPAKAQAPKLAAPAKAAEPARPVARSVPPEPAKPVVRAPPLERPPATATASAKPAAPTQAMGAAAAPPPSGGPARPSFDCAKARSTAEKLICGDAELARMDRELGQVYARAKRAAPDPAAFQRVSDREWRRREAECRDRECLRDWYAERRAQLTSQARTIEDTGVSAATGDPQAR